MTGFARTLRSEFTKVFTLKTWWLFGLILLGYIGFVAAVLAFTFGQLADQMGAAAGDPISAASNVYSAGSSLGLIIPLLFGALLITGEYRHTTLTPTFLAQPHRVTVIAAKVVVAAVFGAVYGLVGLIASVGAGAPILALAGGETVLDEPEIWWLMARTLVAMALWAVLGLGFGALVKNQVVAIVVVIAFTQLVEPILRSLVVVADWAGDIVRFLPGAASDALVGAGIYASFSGADPAAGDASTALDPWQGGLVLGGIALAITIAGALAVKRRDVE